MNLKQKAIAILVAAVLLVVCVALAVGVAE